MKVPMPVVHAFQALTLLVLLVVWTDHASAEDVQPLVVKGSLGGPGVSPSGANDYSVGAQDIANLPQGENTTITDVLTQMPGVAIDQNQQIHIRNTEGPQFQYQINGVLVPLDINTNPPFISMINPMFVEQLSLLDGILPSRYSYATGGVVDIQTKDGFDSPGGSISLMAGQRDTLSPSLEYAGRFGNFSYYLSAQYSEGKNAFSPATASPDPIHNWTNQGQTFGIFTYKINDNTKISLTLSTAASDNQLPNVPSLTPEFNLAGVNNYPSADINSYLNFRDYLAILQLQGSHWNRFVLSAGLLISLHHPKIQTGQCWGADLSRSCIHCYALGPR